MRKGKIFTQKKMNKLLHKLLQEDENDTFLGDIISNEKAKEFYIITSKNSNLKALAIVIFDEEIEGLIIENWKYKYKEIQTDGSEESEELKQTLLKILEEIK